MRPRIGVYPYDSDLHYVLMESYCAVTNRMLLHELVTAPLYDIRATFQEGGANPYILREKYRKWVEYLEDNLTFGTDYIPDFDDLVTDNGKDCCFHGIESCLCDCLFSDQEEWVLFGDDVELAFNLIDRLHEPLLVSDDVHAVIEKILEAHPDMKELILLSFDLDAIYVIRSPRTENCPDVGLAPRGFHAFDNLGDATETGDHPTYVLPADVVAAYLEVARESEERVAAC